MRVQVRLQFSFSGRQVRPGDWLDLDPEFARYLAKGGYVIIPGTYEDRDPTRRVSTK